MKSTYVITRSLIESVFSMGDYVSTVEKAFRLYDEGGVQMPPKVYLTFPRGDLRCMPVYIPSLNISGVKNVNVHPGNKDMPTVMATITLVDPSDGFPLAIMDGTHITNMRTGAAGGVAAKYLSREDSKTAAYIGAGVQAKTQLDALMVTRPGLVKALVYDTTKDHTDDFIEYAKTKHNMGVEAAATVKDAVCEADIVTTTTPVRKPVVKAEDVCGGTHFNAIGADAEGKQELDPMILKKARVVIDNWEQASHSGEINVALTAGQITREDIYCDLGEIVTGKKTGRESPTQVTVFDSTGLAIQDISCASEIYKKLVSDKASETKLEKIDFF